MPFLRIFASSLALLVAACSQPDTWLEDRNGLLGEEPSDHLNTAHRQLLEDHDIDYRVVIESDDGDINRRAVELFKSLSVGEHSDSGRGLLLLLDPGQDRVRIEVSRALEGVYPDVLISYLERHQMVPFFRRNRVADGIGATTELIVTRAQEAEASQAFDPSTLPAASDGAGATTGADLGKGPQPPTAGQPRRELPGGGPRQTVLAYLDAMADRDSRADLPIYTSATRQMLRDWTMTPAQMDNLVSSYRNCSRGEVLQSTDGQFAVLRYGIDERQCPPWFLANSDGSWRLALHVQQQALGFGRGNAWHFRRMIHRYRFGFMDWRLDSNGYPHSERPLRWGLATATGNDGTFVTGVQPGSPAEAFGFQWADKLLTWNDTPVEDHRHVLQIMEQARTNAEQTIEIQRNGQKQVLQGPAPEKAAR